ncbi:MAG: hypothetical protein QXS41_02340 [Candidatus Woesearchaeota archaeon]
MANLNDSNDFIDINNLKNKKTEETEKTETIEEKIIRIEALLRSLIATLDKIVNSPDPYEGKLEEVVLSIQELKEQNKIIAKSLLSVIKQLQSLPTQQTTTTLPTPPIAQQQSLPPPPPPPSPPK